eukprot:TRINITY_DN54407_c0_g1_i1.p1 TRINITY_DN54407_c0_g1~~TRINITY_DN54407_c0_g1_i1.p1  ORF type:complete len:678 (+),score=112.89 TRINITY_DN54407_c0_g1_i1:75-2036(+)
MAPGGPPRNGPFRSTDDVVPDVASVATADRLADERKQPAAVVTLEQACETLAALRVERRQACYRSSGEVLEEELGWLQKDLTLIDGAFHACIREEACLQRRSGPSEATAVLQEFWDQADHALVELLSRPHGDFAEADALDHDDSLVQQWQSEECSRGDLEAAVAAIRAQLSDAHTSWDGGGDSSLYQLRTVPHSANQDMGLSAASSHRGTRLQGDQVRQVATPQRSEQLGTDAMQPRSCEQSGRTAAVGKPARSSFCTAREIFPEQPGRDLAPAAGASTPSTRPLNVSDISRAVLQPQHEGSKSKSGTSRTWSDDWLRIADAEQLERIVPALEATIANPKARGEGTGRDDIAGLEFVKTQIEEVLILPRLHPQLFASVLTKPTRGLLLFGPPGTGKTLLAKWIASECGATFFNIDASSVLSKWIGEAEKTVKALFQLATERQPSVIFVDEIDSLLSKRRDADNEGSRRVKNEFLTSLEGAGTGAHDKVLLVGATNMPWDIDSAVLRRLPKRLYVPLPGPAARLALLRRQLACHNDASGLSGALTAQDLRQIAEQTVDFSGSDLKTLLQEAAMGPVRDAALGLRKRSADVQPEALGGPRDISLQDFAAALKRVRPSFDKDQETRHRAFNDEHGTCHGDDVMQDLSDVGLADGGL